MKHVLLIHADIYAFGGAENHALRLAKIFQDLDWKVTIVHAGGAFDAQRIAQRMGIELSEERCRFETAPVFLRWPGLQRTSVLLRYALVLRHARRIAAGYDLVVGTFGETPIEAARLVQSLHIPLFFADRESLYYLGVRQPTPLRLAARKLNVHLARWLGGWTRATAVRGLLLTNSLWTGGQFRRHYPEVHAKTIYHGASTVVDARHDAYLPHEERRNCLVVVGRVVPFKRIEMAVAIVEQLRNRGHEVTLLIIGQGSGDYAQSVQRLVEGKPYIEWRKGLERDTMERLIASQRWGLHCAEYEHYGLAPLELQRLGCVTFVHDTGGQTETVADARLRYDSVEEAVSKIGSVMSAPALSRALFEQLPTVAAAHSIQRHREAFVAELASIGFLS